MSNKSKELEVAAVKNYLLPFLNLEKQYPLLPGAGNLSGQAAFIGISQDDLAEARQQYRSVTKTAALDLLKQQEVIDGLEAIPFGKDDTIMVIGDSLTDDLQGWFEVFRHVVQIGLDDSGHKLVNAAVYGSTSVDVLKQIDRNLALHKPDWVLVAIGSVDAQRLHGTGERTLVSLADFYENVSTIESMIAEITRKPVIWITPPPPISELMNDMPLFNGVLYEEDLARYREVIAGKAGIIVDPYGRRMGQPPEAWHYLPDGFHPSLSGHLETVKWLLRSFH